MKASTKAKWIVGITSTAFSAFIISNLDQPVTNPNSNIFATEITDSMSAEEKELIQLDWTDFSLQEINGKERATYDRTSRRTG